jgi:hypothetical protein
MKIHCAQLVESALRSALTAGPAETTEPAPVLAPAPGNSLFEQFAGAAEKKVKVVLNPHS